MVGYVHDIGSQIKAVVAQAHFPVTAGGTNDNSEQNGVTIDRTALDQLYMSGVYSILTTVALGASETAVFTANFQDSADGSAWADYGDALATTTLTTSGTYTIVLKADLAGARRYIRVQTLCNLSRANTDTATVSGQLILGGGSKSPTA
jgi:hypothetical protein